MTHFLTDQNFDQELQKAEKPVLVDFWALWCGPCFALSPILEKLAEDHKDEIIFAKVDLDAAPLTAQKYKIEQIPTVILFKDRRPVSGFIGLRTEEAVREWFEKSQTVIKYQEYAEKNGFKLNPDRQTVERLIMGLLVNEKKHGAKYCPCRRIAGERKEDEGKICPCQWHRQEIEKDGHCLCGLFVKE